MGGGSADEVIMTSTSNPEVLSVCYAKGWCTSPDFMLKSEAERVTSIGNTFQSNTSITHFDEFKYFKLAASNTYSFQRCSNLTTIAFPETATSIPAGAFRYCNGFVEFIVPENITSIGGNYAVYEMGGLNVMVLPSTLQSISSSIGKGTNSSRPQYCVICKAVNVPTADTNVFYQSNKLTAFYVPDGSVENYKVAQNYTAGASKIFGFSQLQIDYPDYYNRFILNS